MGKLKYNVINEELQKRIRQELKNGTRTDYSCQDMMAVRRNMERDKASLWRPSFVRDIEKIMHCPYYNRYADKTQVFSFFRNDDITRRALHVQLVARIARNIGKVLGFNLDLIEAAALGHDIGHTPFGHAGERFLNELYYTETGRYFNHNVHSVRVLDVLFSRNVSLQVLDGILCHNGEFAMKEYHPCVLKGFEEFDKKVEECYVDSSAIEKLVPSTLEGCLVRICDMIAYLGKDRQDAKLAQVIDDTTEFSAGEIGVENAELINNLTVNIIENSYGKDYIRLDEKYYSCLKIAKKENYEKIYRSEKVEQQYNETIRPMFREIYYRLLEDLDKGKRESVIYKHHIDFVDNRRKFYPVRAPYEAEEKNQIVVDYIASMTDDYFIDLYHHLFPEGKHNVEYVSYFE